MRRFICLLSILFAIDGCTTGEAPIAPGNVRAASTTHQMIVKAVYPSGCEPDALDASCVGQPGSDNLYWQLVVNYPPGARAFNYEPSSLFDGFLKAIKSDQRTITIVFHVPGATSLDADMSVPVVAFSQTNGGPFQNALASEPAWVTPLTLGRKLTSTPVTIEGKITDTDSDSIIQVANSLLLAMTSVGIGSIPATVALGSSAVQGVVASMEDFEEKVQKSRSGDTPLSSPQIVVYPAYLQSIDVSQTGLFKGGDGELFRILVRWQHSIFAQPVSSGWLDTKVLQTPDDDPTNVGNTPAPHTFLRVIQTDPTVSGWKAGTPITGDVCKRIMKIGEDGGLAPVDQVILVFSWLQNESWNTEIALHDPNDSCTAAIAVVMQSKDFPQGATATTAFLDSTVKPRPSTEILQRSGPTPNDAFAAFRQTLTGSAGSDDRLAPTVTVSITQRIKELDDFLSLANASGQATATVDATKLRSLFAEQGGANPLVYDNSQKGCFTFTADAASNEVTLRCMKLKRADGTTLPLQVVLLTDKPIFTDGKIAKIQSIQFSLP